MAGVERNSGNLTGSGTKPGLDFGLPRIQCSYFGRVEGSANRNMFIPHCSLKGELRPCCGGYPFDNTNQLVCPHTYLWKRYLSKLAEPGEAI